MLTLEFLRPSFLMPLFLLARARLGEWTERALPVLAMPSQKGCGLNVFITNNFHFIAILQASSAKRNIIAIDKRTSIAIADIGMDGISEINRS